MANETRTPTDNLGASDRLGAIEPACRGTDGIAGQPTAPKERIDRRRFLGGAVLAGLTALAISRRHGIARTIAPAGGLERVGIPPFPKTPDGLTLFTINEFDTAADALPVSLSVPSQDWLRAWFKWGNAPDWSKMTGDVARAHQAGALFGGGTTCSALYPHENGITKAQFMDMATRDPYGRLHKVSNAYYHGAIENPAYRRYVLKWATLQIEAGVDTLFMDEVCGAYSSHEGYDPYGLAAFRRYLLRRFVESGHWRVDDPRWKSQFQVDCDDPRECPDHSIRTFDYAAYLRKNHWANHPDQPANPLAGIWGRDNWAVSGETYCVFRNNAVWRYWTSQLRAYAAKRQRRVWIAANGLNRWVDYQIAGGGTLWNFPLQADGKLKCAAATISHMAAWRQLYTESRGLLHGKDVPVVVFNDWGDGMPWMDKLTNADRAAWLGAYAPEIFACGLFFAYPVHGPFGCNAATDGTLGVIQRQARFVQSVSPLLRRVTWQDPSAASYDGKAVVTLQAQPAAGRVIAHLVNQDYAGMTPIQQTGKGLRMALAVRPKAVRIHNADTGEVTTAQWSYDPHDTLPGRRTSGLLKVAVPSLLTWNVLRIDLPHWAPLPGASVVTIPCALLWQRPSSNLFHITGSAPPLSMNGFVQGRLHADLRNNPTFIVRFRQAGRFEMHVNSVAGAGAHLLIKVDGKLALAQHLVNTVGGKNHPTANDIDQTFSVSVPAGLHRISVNNDGADWFTVDWYKFVGL
jgi:hypothetical protein